MHHVLPKGNSLSRHEIHPGDSVNGWTFLERPAGPNSSVRCRCECGVERSVSASNILRGFSSRCRSCASRLTSTTHGASDAGGKHSAERLYRIWKAMKWRCNPKNTRDNGLYHTRGIAVCDEWRRDYASFRAWSAANGYEDGMTIDRIDGGAGYSPDNCRWATHHEQARNTRRNRIVAAFGETKTAVEWTLDGRCAVKPSAFYARLRRGWPDRAALTTPHGGARP